MKKLDRFILKSFIGPFVAILLVVIFVLMMQFLWLYIDELVGKGLGLKVILEFLMWGICTILPMAIPLATLLASMMTVGQLAENNELMAIKAAGISFGRVMAPLTAASVVICLGTFWAGDSLVPKAYNEIFTLRDDISKTKEQIKIPSGTFYDGIDGYILRVEEQQENGLMKGVMVYNHSSNKGNDDVTLADSAYMRLSKNKDFLIFTMYNGTNYREENKKSYRDTVLKLDRIDFQRQEITIPLSNYTFEKSDTSRFGDQRKTMNLKQLIVEHDTLKIKLAQSHAANVNSMLGTSSLFRSNQLDTSFNAAGMQNFHDDKFMEWDSYQDKAKAYLSAYDQSQRYLTDFILRSGEINQSSFWLRHTDIELLKKFAQALACLLLFFIGAPLGALMKKGGLGVSAIVSVLFFVLYWVVDISGTKLAKDGAIDASTGAFISAYVLAPIGAFLTYKAVKDSEIFSSMDSFKIWWKKTISRIVRFFKPVRIVYMGTPDFAVAPLDTLIKNGLKVVGVVTVADKPSGRGLKVNESAVKKYAVEHGIPVLQPVKLKDPEFLSALKAWKADLFVVVAFRMLPEEVWKMPKLGTFNLHAALLPQYRGAAPINWAVINGERITGATTFMIDHQIDTGGIILRQDCRIAPDDTAGDVHDRLMEIGSELVLQTVNGIIENNVELRVQRSFIQGSEVLKPAPKLTRELCHIDWDDTTANIHNLIRGLSPYPTAFTELVPATLSSEVKPLQLKIFKAEKMELEQKMAPGTVISDGKKFLAIATRDGAISIRDLQLQGKKRMPVESFLLGFREPQGYVCTQGTSRTEIEKTRV